MFGRACARLLLTLCAIASGAGAARAQQADVIRGRVTGDDGQAIANAVVRATSIPNNVGKASNTDKNGRFTIAFPAGEGDYWISVSAIGFAPRRFELKRVADEEILVADAKLVRTAAVLDAVQVKAERAKASRNNSAVDISGTEKSVGAGSIDPSQAGNLAAMAAALPGVQLIPGAEGSPDQFSVFGLGGDQNTTTLNGLGFGAADVPRDAATRSTLGTTPWDVSRGGFSGGQFGLRTQSGSNFSARGLSSILNAPALEWTDRAGRATGAQYGSVSLGASTAGPIVLDNSFYSAGYQFDRRSSDLQSLTSGNALALQSAGVALDSATRFRNALARAGVPIAGGVLPGEKISERGSFLAAFDFSPPTATSGQSLNVTAGGTFSRVNAPFGQYTAMPSTDAERTNWFGSVQARHTNYFGFGILTETSLGVSRTRAYTDPYLSLPGGSVRVTSALEDSSTAISQLAFGGSPVQNTQSTGTTVAAQNQLSWFSADNKHRIKLATELRAERFAQDVSMNRLGTFTYNSLGDLDAGKPSSFTRLLAPRERSGAEGVGALSIGDTYRPSTDLQFQYGVRIDANRFATAPVRNSDLARSLGVDNGEVPNGLYVSPRAGFSWTYGQAAQLAIADGFVRGPRAVVRGGVGVFQSTPGAQLIGPALSATGLAGSLQQLTCVGDAVPTPNWSAYAVSAGSIPSTCADGTTGSVFANSAPSVSLFQRGFAAPRSLRSNLNWSGALFGSRLAGAVDGTFSLNLNQPGFIDRNFNALSRFALASEGGRPVYVQASSIVPLTGVVAAQDARVDQAYSRVIEQRSDLRSTNRQLYVALRPVTFSTRYSWELGYVYSNTRDISRGFSSTAGNPLDTEWGRSSLDSRHQVVYSLSYNFFDWVPVSWTGTFRSGRPYTPLVSDDINGDGFANDRAFVFGASSSDAAVAAGMRDLLSGGSPSARACLAAQTGSLAARNSCQAPWLTTSTLTAALNPVKFGLPQRLNLSFFVNNAFGAADLLLHGESRRRGWGQATAPDQTLLYVRGFDPVTRAFRYEVNQRFGATDLARTVNRNPVVVTAQLRMDVGFTRERQLLTQSLDRGRGRPGERQSDTDIRGLAGALIPANPMALILQQADSLKLTRRQADSVARLNRAYTLRSDSIWSPVVKYLAELPASYDRAEAYDRYRRAREASVDMLRAIAPSLRTLLTAPQLQMLPPAVSSSLDVRYLASIRSSTAGGASMGILGMLAQMGAMGGSTDASGTQTVMIHK